MKRRILVVDDESPIREMLRQVFESAGYEVFEASDGQSAMSVVHEEPMDLVITDLVMPYGSGLEVVGEVVRNHPGTKVIAMSGNSQAIAEGSLEAARLMGAHGVFSKPFGVRALQSAVRELIG